MSDSEPDGDEVGEGWAPIVRDCHEKLQHLDPNYRIDDIKEKFGGLRYYYTPSVEWGSMAQRIMDDIVTAAEVRCSRTCETCGQPGKIRGGSWYLTLCDTCDAKRTIERLARQGQA